MLVSIQATVDPKRPNWEEEFYLKCSLRVQEITKQRERKTKEDTDAEKKQIETHLQNQQISSRMFSLYQMSIKSSNPPIVPSPNYGSSQAAKFIIHTGDDTQNIDSVKKSINAVLMGSMGSGPENIQIKGDPSIINDMAVDLLMQIKALARSIGDLEMEKLAVAAHYNLRCYKLSIPLVIVLGKKCCLFPACRR